MLRSTNSSRRSQISDDAIINAILVMVPPEAGSGFSAWTLRENPDQNEHRRAGRIRSLPGGRPQPPLQAVTWFQFKYSIELGRARKRPPRVPRRPQAGPFFGVQEQVMNERKLYPISWEERRNALRLAWGLFIALLIFFIVLASIFFWRVQTLLHLYDDATQTSHAQLKK